jgi:hypothetical protein
MPNMLGGKVSIGAFGNSPETSFEDEDGVVPEEKML